MSKDTSNDSSPQLSSNPSCLVPAEDTDRLQQKQTISTVLYPNPWPTDFVSIIKGIFYDINFMIIDYATILTGTQ